MHISKRFGLNGSGEMGCGSCWWVSKVVASVKRCESMLYGTKRPNWTDVEDS